MLGLVLCVVVTITAAGVWCYGWLVARRRGRQHREWARLAARLRDLDEHLDRVWATERTWRRP